MIDRRRATAGCLAVGLLWACGGAPANPPVHVAKTPASAAPPAPAPVAVETEVDERIEPSALVYSACDDTLRAVDDDLEQRLADMRRELDREFRDWQTLPRCGSPEALETGGGGGRGEGIGLGAIGTLGHGAGTGGSVTNVQVPGVDEADMVKHDGRYLYAVSGGALNVLEASPPRLVSATRVPGAAKELFVANDRVVVFSSLGTPSRARCTYGYDCDVAGDGTRTRISVFDVRDRAAPRLVRTLVASGSLITSRRIDRAVHVVLAEKDVAAVQVQTWLDDLPSCRGQEGLVRARFAALEAKNERILRAAAAKVLPELIVDGKKTQVCDVYRATAKGRPGYTSLLSFDLTDDHAPPKTATIESRPGAVYASENRLYFASSRGPERHRAAHEDLSDVHAFALGADPSLTRYVASGAVRGHVLGQFALDERDGALRVATTLGRVPDPAVESAVSILRETTPGQLRTVGALRHLAPSEDIRAVRFDGDRAYVVTFKKTDPLFVLDLQRDEKPRVLGELKIPGFSTYLHRIDPDHLLSVGFDADDHGDFAYFDGLLVQLFDVTSPTEPKLLHRYKIGTRGSSSEAATNHLAFMYLQDRGLLALPSTVCSGGGDGVHGNIISFSGLLLFQVSAQTGVRELGRISHGRAGVSCGTWWSHASSKVKRSVVVGDVVFSVAEDRIKVQHLQRLGQDLADVALVR